MVPLNVAKRLPVPGVGAVCVMPSEKVVPGVMVAPAPVTVVWNWPRLEKVKGVACTELLTPVKVIVVRFPGAPKVMVLLPPLNDPVVEKVTVSARATPWPSAKIAMIATHNAKDFIGANVRLFIYFLQGSQLARLPEIPARKRDGQFCLLPEQRVTGSSSA